MIGVVEIYSKFGTPEQELIHTENNLIVNGAGETICDMLTLPSSVADVTTGPGDSSNFTVQAISFGKSSDAYKENAHFHPGDVSSYYIWSPPTGSEAVYFSALPEYAKYVSAVKYDNVIRAVSLENENIDSTTSSYDPKRDPGTTPNPNDTQLEPNTMTAIDYASGQAHKMGDRMMQGRSHAHGHNLNKIMCGTNPNLLSFTDGPPVEQDFRLGNNVMWSSSLGGLSSIELQGDNTGPFYGTSSFLVSAVNNKQLLHLVPEHRTQFHHNVDHTLSFYAKQPVGASGTTSSIIINLRDTTGSKNHSVGISYFDQQTLEFGSPSAVLGTVGNLVSTPNGADAYITPASGADGSAGWYRFELVLPGLGTDAATKNTHSMRAQCKFLGAGGQMAPLEMYGWQLEERYGASEFKRVAGLTPTFDEGGINGDLFLGCYPHTSGTNFAILNSISNIDKLSDYVEISGAYPNSTNATFGNNFFNSSAIRSMDENGFIRAYAPSSTTGDFPIYPSSISAPLAGGEGADPASGMIVSALSDFSSTGEVMYICTISSGDLGLANMYGGLYKCGLWTIDLEKTLSDRDPHGIPKIPPTFPLRFSSGYNRLVYKLFAEKSFTKNLAAIKDHSNEPGCFKYQDLTLVWRIKFI